MTVLADTLERGGAGTSQRGFLAVSALLFAVSVAATILWNSAMPGMSGMPMPGGWMLSTTWTPSCGRSWMRAATSFLGMWMVMMAAMMLPSLVPMLQRYRQAVGRRGRTRLGLLTGLVGAGYAVVWLAVGAVAFALGSALTAIELTLPMLSRAVPLGAGLIVLAAGALQFTVWKARRLACCRATPRPGLSPDPGTAWRHGLRLGVHCLSCCAGPTSVLLVGGVMDLRVMALVTAAITAERLAPSGERIARVLGALLVGTGMALIVEAAMPG